MATADFDFLLELGQVAKKAAEAPISAEKRSAVRELEDLLALLNFQLSRIDRTCERWSEAISAAAIEFNWDESRQLSALYQGWLDAAGRLPPHLSEWDAKYSPLRGAEEFWSNLRRVQLMSLDTDRTKRSIESLQQGKGSSFGSAMEELRHTLR
jgi:hypothetical protein